MRKSYIALILFAAFLLRIFIAPLYHHSDADTIFYWAKYLWETKNFLFFMGKAVPNAMPAIYPPIFYFLLFIWRGFYELIGQFLWWLNLHVSFFPSNLIFWYQSYEVGIAFNKLIAIFADFGCGFLIYRIIQTVGGAKKLAFWSLVLFLFLPFSWYNSAYWGQIESLYCFFILAAFFLAFKNKFLLATFSMGVSALIKPTGLVVLPIFIVLLIKQKKFVDFIAGLFFLSIFSFLLFFAFQPINTISWSVDFYFRSFRGEIVGLVANAFNFWALIFGFDQKPDSFLIMGAPVRYCGFVMFAIFLSAVIYNLARKKITNIKVVQAAFLCTFASFLFLTRMHERYFYTALIFLAILSGINKKWLIAFVVMSMIHFFNLYHFWWQPKIPFLIDLLSNLFVIRVIIVVSLMFFGYSLFKLFHDESYGNNR